MRAKVISSLLLVGLCNASSVFALNSETLATHEGMKLTYIKESSQGNNRELQIALPKAATPQIFALQNPDRLVIDIASLKIRQNKTVALTGDEPVKAVRMGIHPDRTRLVIDLKPGQIPNYSVDADGKVVTLVFGEKIQNAPVAPPMAKNTENSDAVVNAANTAITSSAKTDTANATVTKSVEPLAINKEVTPNVAKSVSAPIVAAKDSGTTKIVTKEMSEEVVPLSPSNPASRLVNETEEEAPKANLSSKTLLGNAQTSTSAASSLVSQNDNNKKGSFGLASVKGIDFSKATQNKIPMIKVTMNQKAPYTLMKTGQRAYRLVIPNAKFEQEHLTLPHFPPQDFAGITLVNPEKGTGQVEFFIGVERNVKLSSFANENEIWIKVASEK